MDLRFRTLFKASQLGFLHIGHSNGVLTNVNASILSKNGAKNEKRTNSK